MFKKLAQSSLILSGLLSLSAPALAQSMTWEEWNHSSSPFCGFISIFCAPRPVPPAPKVAALPEPMKPLHKHKYTKHVDQPKAPS